MNNEGLFIFIRIAVVLFLFLGLGGGMETLLGYEKKCENSREFPAGHHADEECLDHIQWAKNSWKEHFERRPNPIIHRGLGIQCEKSLQGFVVSCMGRPWAYSGDRDAYEAVEIVSFMSAKTTESGEKELIGRIHPTW